MFDAITGAFDEDVTATIVSAGCDARLDVVVVGNTLSGGYSPGETIVTGAAMDITLMLLSDGRGPLSERISRDSRPSDSVVLWEGSDLPREPQDAPLWWTTQSDVCATFAGWFGGSSRGGDLRELLNNITVDEAGMSDTCGGYDTHTTIQELLEGG
ncbi:MAG: hypothetical protein A2135_01875 [Actinobacteria bacterium RBG_16_67_15]|nr:MAG: hypothetical protein A2135_01875 [Actinobacteria bacterium RBG_16_67_15]